MSAWQELLQRQAGVVHRRQALAHGWSADQVRHRIRRESWVRLHPGVYQVRTGEPAFLARVWAALLHAGPPAMASHLTAARLQGLVDEDPTLIEVSVPHGHRAHGQVGVRIHHPRAWPERRQPAASVPQTRVEDTVLDLVGLARTSDPVVQWVLRACQRRLTTPDRLRGAMAARRRQRHRHLVKDLLVEASSGVASPLERRYRQGVELSHGLPTGRRGEAWWGPDGRRRYSDVRYAAWWARVELEGLAYHPDDRSWVDQARDNAAVVLGDVVLRYGWRAVAGRRPSPPQRCSSASPVTRSCTVAGNGTGRREGV
jgi:hypothetical protein